MKIAYGYGRKSLVRIATDHFSPARQRRTVEGWCKHNGYELIRFFEDAEGYKSGRTSKRPGWQQLLKAIEEQPPDAVVFEEVSRAGRKVRLLANFADDMEQLGVRVVFARQGIDYSSTGGKTQFHIQAALAEDESNRTSDRMKWHIEAQQAQGKYWGTPPFGAVRDDDGKLKQDPVFYAALLRLFELYSTGRYSWDKVAQKLSAEGFEYRGRGGVLRPFNHDDIRRCLDMAELYKGNLTKGRSQGENNAEIIYHGAWQPLVPVELVQVAEQVRKMRTGIRGAISGRKVYELTPILHCAACGVQLMGQRENLIGKPRVYRHRVKGDCPYPVAYIRASEIEPQVRQLVGDLCLPLEQLPLLEQVLLERVGSSPATQARIDELEQQKKRMKKAYFEQQVRGLELVTWGEFYEQLQALEEEAEGLRAGAGLQVERVRAMLQQIGDVGQLLKNAEPLKKKAVYGAFFTEILVNIKEARIETFRASFEGILKIPCTSARERTIAPKTRELERFFAALALAA